VASVLEFEPRRISVEEYHKMIEAGIFDEDERLELLEGVIVSISPQSPDHADLVQWLTNRLVRLIGDRYDVRPQLPLVASPMSEPEPDLAVVPAGRTRDRHPTNALLVIEVARESLRKDRLLKAALYARAGIPEYWIVNPAEKCVEVHRDPDPSAGRYTTVTTVARGGELIAVKLPQIRIAVGELFGE
jgi:Uma2 family endonuclease